MTQEGWEKAIKDAHGKPEVIEMLAKYLSEIDEAKQILCDKGYSWTGFSLLQTVKTIPHHDSKNHATIT